MTTKNVERPHPSLFPPCSLLFEFLGQESSCHSHEVPFEKASTPPFIQPMPSALPFLLPSSQERPDSDREGGGRKATLPATLLSGGGGQSKTRPPGRPRSHGGPSLLFQTRGGGRVGGVGAAGAVGAGANVGMEARSVVTRRRIGEEVVGGQFVGEELDEVEVFQAELGGGGRGVVVDGQGGAEFEPDTLVGLAEEGARGLTGSGRPSGQADHHVVSSFSLAVDYHLAIPVGVGHDVGRFEDVRVSEPAGPLLAPSRLSHELFRRFTRRHAHHG